MYARFATFLLGEGQRADAEATAAQIENVMKDLKGFKSVTFVADESIGEYGIFSVWASKEDADSAGETLNAHFQDALKDDYEPPSTLRMFEVFSPTSD
jgi:heme-degrading monooxygenase HmoA